MLLLSSLPSEIRMGRKMGVRARGCREENRVRWSLEGWLVPQTPAGRKDGTGTGKWPEATRARTAAWDWNWLWDCRVVWVLALGPSWPQQKRWLQRRCGTCPPLGQRCPLDGHSRLPGRGAGTSAQVVSPGGRLTPLSLTPQRAAFPASRSAWEGPSESCPASGGLGLSAFALPASHRKEWVAPVTEI